jgi:uncharacterized RDD family membrane protein YckC
MKTNAQGREYAGLWSRLGANIIDMVIWTVPLFFVEHLFEGPALRNAGIVWNVVSLLLGAWYYIVLVVKLGGTPGRLLLKTTITQEDGSNVTYTQAILRHSISFCFLALCGISSVITLTHLPDAAFLDNVIERDKAMMLVQPIWGRPVIIATSVWWWSEFVVLLLTPKRQGIQDLIAKTVVLMDPPLTKEDKDQEFVS